MYVDKQQETTANMKVTDVVMRLASPWSGKGRNIMTDNFFSSVGLVEKLMAQKYIYCWHIARNNKCNIPPIKWPSQSKVSLDDLISDLTDN
ncbi:hypothetical protein T10_9563 [Trichinella papuae]|uniref:PiggyBac transposable element-derived protein domain-containing protein n=1 Tax=Trichinella papuae TaxID=268474 RepID=A0A0V1MPL1_9BILA|nr:hypothetical protein T10_9563 [Trichinella papuae]